MKTPKPATLNNTTSALKTSSSHATFLILRPPLIIPVHEAELGKSSKVSAYQETLSLPVHGEGWGGGNGELKKRMRPAKAGRTSHTSGRGSDRRLPALPGRNGDLRLAASAQTQQARQTRTQRHHARWLGNEADTSQLDGICAACGCGTNPLSHRSGRPHIIGHALQ